MKALTIEEQIDILTLAKKHYLKNICHEGMCYSIYYILDNEDIDTDNFDIDDYIPSFNRDSLIVAGNMGLIPEVTGYIYWWDRDDTTIRPKVFDYLIEELEKLK